MGDSERESFKRIIRELQEENKNLKEENAYLKFELQELKTKIYKKKGGKDNPPPEVQTPPKKRGIFLGHLGWFRKKPPQVDKIVEVTLDQCPRCGGKTLKECGTPTVHIQEDIVFPKSEVTAFHKRRYYCPSCKKLVQGLGEEELPRSFIGPLAKSVAAFFKYRVKVSDRDIQKIFQNLFGLRVTPSAIPGFRNQLGQRLGFVRDKLHEKIKHSSFLHVDETGWRLEGKNHWLWNFSNNKVSFCHIDPSRGQKVPEAILGDRYGGVLVSDFLSAYNKIQALAKQRCLVHLLRDLKRVRECLWDDLAVQRFCQNLEGLIRRAVDLARARDQKKISKKSFERKRGRIEDTLQDVTFQDPKHRILQRFVKRLDRHKEELLTFLYHPGVDWQNNHAERMIRPNVLLRKITFGNRSEKGILNHGILMSIIQTAGLNGLDPLKTLRELLSFSSQAKTLAALVPP